MRKHPLRAILLGLAAALLLVLCYGVFWPLDAKVNRYTAPAAPGYAGDFAENDLLSGMGYLDIAPYARPEHLEYRDGYVYASTHGKIIRIRETGGTPELVVDGAGETLGFVFDGNGDILFCDVLRDGTPGVYRADLSSLPAKVYPVVTEVGGTQLVCPDALTVASDGTIYISDATSFSPVKYGGADAVYNCEYWYHSGTGRVLAYDPETGQGRTLVSGLSFCNGITLSTDEKFLYVAETNEYSIWKISVTARDAFKGDEEFQLLIGNLPGFPDNVSRGTDGKYWCGLTAPRNEAGDSILAKPLLRRFLMRIYPAIMQTGGEACSTCFAFDDDGNIIEFLMDREALYPEITGVCETPDRLYLHMNNSLGVIGFIEK